MCPASPGDPGPPAAPRGRGAASNPTSRFDRLAYAPDPGEGPDSVPTEYFRDASRSILAENDSPDIPFRRSLNHYRGCTHGCIYCYARPTHEYLGLSAGLDFETRIFIKEDAPTLLRAELAKPSYRPETIAISGVTDPYQFVERGLRLTRRCLEILSECRHPVSLITKSALITRDLDLLAELARHRCVNVTLTITTLDHDLQRRLEPRASTPRARLDAVRQLAEAGIPTGINIAPVIPGLTDHEIPAILSAARQVGARSANWTLLRLPHGVKDLFAEWLAHHEPLKKEKVLSKLRQLHGGKVYSPQFGTRMSGQGPLSEQIDQLFRLHQKRNQLDRPTESLNTESFRPPTNGQMDLFHGE